MSADLHLENDLAVRLDGPGPHLVAGMDEVGRGALAGPVVVGAAAVWIGDDTDAGAGAVRQPVLRDSKALTNRRRRALVPEIRAWAAGVGIGEARAGEVDELGITGALALAGKRAWAQLRQAAGTVPHALILDGRDDWLTRHGAGVPRPSMQVKAEDLSATVAAAAICAKVHRDDLMIALDAEHPQYGWAQNKGYGAAVHRAALLEHGTSPYHRLSWNLGVPGTGPAALFDMDVTRGAGEA